MSGGNPQSQSSQSSSTQNQNMQSRSQTGPNPYIQGQLQGLADFIYKNYTNLPGGNPIATPSLATQSVNQTAVQRGLNGMDYGLQQTYKPYAQNVLAGKFLNLNNNPYFQGAMSASLKPATENFLNNILPGLQSQFGSAGRPGSGAGQQQIDQATTNFNRAATDAVTQAGNQAYQFERGMQGSTLGMMPALNSIDWQNIMGAAQGGQAIDAYNQAMKTAPIDYATRIAMMLQGAMPGGVTDTSGSSSGSSSNFGFGSASPASNPLGMGIGAGMSALGMALPFMFGFSDERLKKNIRPVGKSYTGHTLYQYEFLGSDKPEVGVLAQEVEQKDPAAVVTHPSGFKMVNYNRAMSVPAGGLM